MCRNVKTSTNRSLLSDLRPSKSYGGEAGLPCRSIHEQVCREGGERRAPVIGDDLKISLALAGGPKPCSDVGPRTVIVICRDDFKICTHLFFHENLLILF